MLRWRASPLSNQPDRGVSIPPEAMTWSGVQVRSPLVGIALIDAFSFAYHICEAFILLASRRLAKPYAIGPYSTYYEE